ncbi:acyl-CoA dehydrogenase [Rhodococcus sp. 14C212]|uniref:acyl-CoA dehydrogenase family protein n=1 Tax=Rhodococcus sp. 14C212 TaxID=2711209 RepID=UPI0013EA3D2A|nr:acyl-CoA dehydrogenase [Rhodococcus sp. 14C212]
MNTVDTIDGSDLRTEIRELIAKTVPDGWRGIGALSADEAGEFHARWRAALRDARLLAPTWPERFGGRGLGVEDHALLFEELFSHGLPLWNDTDAAGISLLGNAILHWGSEAIQEQFLPRILSGEDVWCQGFSEPGAGSDLAAVSTRAILESGTWRINGQKIWSSAALRSNWIFMLARTEPDAPTHRGISMLLVPMDQPGIDARPIRNIRGDDEFCEIFFTDATTDGALILGERGDGWKVAMSLLGYERGETVLYVPWQFDEELQRLVGLARETGAISDPQFRARLAGCHVEVAQLKAMGAEALARLVDGHRPGPEGGVFKVLYSEYHQRATELALDMLGSEAAVLRGRPSATWLRADDPGSPNSPRSWLEVFLNARAESIYAGTNQIQRNIVGELLLGLPREPR